MYEIFFSYLKFLVLWRSIGLVNSNKEVKTSAVLFKCHENGRLMPGILHYFIIVEIGTII